MRGRKTVVAVLLFTFLMSLTASAGAATFKDMDNHWANKDVSRMYAKGIVAGYGDEYRPNESISREQAVVMLIRTMGLAGETAGQSLGVNFRNPEAVSKDFQPSIALAIKQGIISGGDLLDFRPKEAAKRYEIAVLIARGMGFNAETGVSGTLPFSDTKELNDRAPWAVPFANYVYRQGIMSGDVDGSFRPMEQVTRAEMAVLLSRVDAKLNKLTANSLKGEAYSVSIVSNSILVQDGSQQIITVPVMSNANIFKENKPVSLGDLKKGDKLEIIKNNQGQAAYLEVIPAAQFAYDRIQVTGKIEKIESGTPVVLTVRTASGLTTYSLATDINLTVDGLVAGIKDILVGQEVSLTVADNAVVELKGRNVEREISGEVDGVNFGLTPSLTIKDSQGDKANYVLGRQTRIDLDGYSADLEDLAAGQQIKATVLGQEISRLWATSFSDTITGTLVRADFAPKETLVVKVETAKNQWSELTYEVGKDAKIRRDRRAATLRDLLPGDQIEIELKNNKVAELNAEKIELETEGRIVSITLAYNPSLVLIDSKGQERKFTIASDARLRKDRNRIVVNELEVDDYVSVRVEGQSIVDLWAEDRIVNDHLVGTIGEINEDAGVLVLDDLQEGSRFGVGIYVKGQDLRRSETRIIKFGNDIRFKDLEVGDRIIVVGKAESYRFDAETIVVIGAAR